MMLTIFDYSKAKKTSTEDAQTDIPKDDSL